MKSLLVAGLLYSEHISRPAIDVMSMLSSLTSHVDVVYVPVFSYKSIGQSIRSWLARELTLLKRVTSNGRYDLLVVHQMVANLVSVVAKIRGVKVIVYVGGSIYEGLYQKGFFKRLVAFGLALFWRVQLRLADLIVIPEREIIGLSRLDSYASKIRVAPTRIIDPVWGRRRNKSLRENVIGYVGRFENEKGVDRLPEIISWTIETGNSIPMRWILVGDGALRQTVEDDIRALGCEDRVQFVGWVRRPEEYMEKLKLLVLPSRTEGLPNVVLEAMATGTPVLATRVGGISNVISEGETGFLLESTDPKFVAERVVELLGDPELLEKISSNAQKWVRENFSEEKALESWRRMLQELETR